LRAQFVFSFRASALLAQQRQEKDLPLAKMPQALLDHVHVQLRLAQREKGENEGGHAYRDEGTNGNQKQSLDHTLRLPRTTYLP
jgi:hypothetical protein